MTSSTGRVPVRVEDVYTDSEDEGTRDSQPQGGLRLSFKEDNDFLYRYLEYCKL